MEPYGAFYLYLDVISWDYTHELGGDKKLNVYLKENATNFLNGYNCSAILFCEKDTSLQESGNGSLQFVKDLEEYEIDDHVAAHLEVPEGYLCAMKDTLITAANSSMSVMVSMELPYSEEQKLIMSEAMEHNSSEDNLYPFEGLEMVIQDFSFRISSAPDL